MNGVENEGAKLLKEIKKQAGRPETQNELGEERTARARSHVAEDSADEGSVGAQSDESGPDTPSSGSEKEELRGSGETTGTHRKADTTRRRSSRVKKTKG